MSVAKGHNRKYAFNIGLVGTEFPEKEEHVLLRVDKWTSSAAHDKNRLVDDMTTPEELDLTHKVEEVDAALWVGIRPAKAEYVRHQKSTPVDPNDEQMVAAFNAAKPAFKKNLSVDLLGSLPALPILPTEEGATKVVVKFGHQDRLLFYELINRDEKTKLCVASPIEVPDVFFFPAYRVDSLSSQRERATLWSQTIKAYVAKELNATLASTGFRPARSTARVEFQHTVSGLLDLQGLINEFAVSGADWVLDELERLLTAKDSDTTGQDILDILAVHNLLDLQQNFTRADAEHLTLFVKKSFPGLAAVGPIGPEFFELYAEYLRFSKTRITYGSLRTHLGLYFWSRREHEIDESNEGKAREFFKYYKLDIASRWDFFHEDPQLPPPQFEKVSSDLKLWLKHHHDIMKKIVSIHRSNMDAIINWHGTALCGDNLWQIWENVGESPDTDAAKQFVLQAMRYTAREMIAKSEVTTTNLESYMQLIKKGMADLSDEGEEDAASGGED